MGADELAHLDQATIADKCGNEDCNEITDHIAHKLYHFGQLLGEQIDLRMSGIQCHIAAGQEDHGDVEILNDLGGCGNTFMEDLFAQHVEKCDKHD